MAILGTRFCLKKAVKVPLRSGCLSDPGWFCSSRLIQIAPEDQFGLALAAAPRRALLAADKTSRFCSEPCINKAAGVSVATFSDGSFVSEGLNRALCLLFATFVSLTSRWNLHLAPAAFRKQSVIAAPPPLLLSHARRHARTIACFTPLNAYLSKYNFD